jgi:hypothetical protein
MYFNKQNLDYIKEYLDEKNKLTKSKNISNSEQEELYTLFNYRGEKLKKEWKWIKNISIVYLLTERDINTINLLKYSLRSIEYYLPWFNGKIFIIVQCILCIISLVNIKNKHIKIINPKDFISKKIRIEYSKETIEMYLDKIPKISVRFIYLIQNNSKLHKKILILISYTIFIIDKFNSSINIVCIIKNLLLDLLSFF